jgi:hypothetical protein
MRGVNVTKSIMRPLLAVILISMCTALAGCHKSHPPHPAAAPAPPPPLPVVKAEDVPAPPQPSVVLEKGMVLKQVAVESYGHDRFAGMLLKFNKIADANRIKAGTVIKTPSIPEIFKEEGLDPKYQPAINALAKATHDFYALLPDYRAERTKAMTDPDNKKITLPVEMKEKLDQIADAVAAAAAVFAGAAPPHKTPNATVQEFRQAAIQIRALGAGVVKAAEEDEHLVGQRLGLGMTNALIWVQQGYQ